MLNSKLVKFCDDNFNDGKSILTQLSEYKKILLKENETMNLIGKSTINYLDERHLLDCIQIVKYLPHHEKSVMDLGTGAGLPGIILSIIGFKNLHLVEKSPKKSSFLENCKLRLGLNYVVHNKSVSEIFALCKTEVEVQSPSTTLISNWLLGKVSFSSFESIRVIS